MKNTHLEGHVQGCALQATLRPEVGIQLNNEGYHQNKSTTNSRNGYGKKTIHTKYGDMEI